MTAHALLLRYFQLSNNNEWSKREFRLSVTKRAGKRRINDMQTERVRVSRQAEHYLLKSQPRTRPGDVLYREESDNTGRRVLSLSPVGASLFNRSLVQTYLCESAFHSRGSAQPKLLKAAERILKPCHYECSHSEYRL